MQNQRRIESDLRDAMVSLPGIGICPIDGRLDLFFANITCDVAGSPLLMPCMIHLESDYPISPPNVGFPVHFPYSMGASYTKDDGPLCRCQVLCLNITGNFKHVHDEWAAQVGEGWSPSMTISSLLVQLQSVLMDMGAALVASEAASLRKALGAFTFAVDDGAVHTFAAPHPRPSADSAGGGAAAAAQSGGARCYITGASEAEDVLGIGFSIDGKGNATTPAEVLSWTAFDARGVRQSSSKERFDLFWPRIPAAAAVPPAFGAVQAQCVRAAGAALAACGGAGADAFTTVTSKLINGLIVEMMRGEKADATRYVEALLDLRRLVARSHSAIRGLRDAHAARIRGFVGDEARRHKDAEPNLGDFLALYMCLPAAAPRAAFLDAYVDENFQRCAMWWRRAGAPDRAREVFAATRVSRDICLFQLAVLAAAADAADGAGGEAAAAAAGRLDALQREWRATQAAVEAGGWAAFLERAGCSEETRRAILGDVDRWVAACAAKAMARGPKYGGGGGGGGGRGGGRGGGGGGGRGGYGGGGGGGGRGGRGGGGRGGGW